MRRHAWFVAATACAVVLAASPVEASPHEVYIATRASLYTSTLRLVAGAGGVLGYRLHVAPMFGVYAEAGAYVYAGYHGTASVGVSIDPREARGDGWRPLFGVQATMWFGDQVRIVTESQPSLPSPVAWAAQVRLAPLRFAVGGWQVSALAADVGIGFDPGLALGLELIQIGYRF